MGAWHFAQAPLRLRTLRVALDEYVRFGLEAGVFIVSQRGAAGRRREVRAASAAAPARSKPREPPARAGRTTPDDQTSRASATAPRGRSRLRAHRGERDDW